MKYTDNEMSIVLLCSHVGISKDSDEKPLSLGEWRKFYDNIVKAKLEPCVVLKSFDDELINMGYDNVFIERIKKLVDRGAAVSFDLQEYEKKGIYVTTEISKTYPIMLRRQLKDKKPPILFYAGNPELANKIGIGVVGSRNVSISGTEFTKSLVQKAVEENIIIFSGGAKGVDTTSETVALNSGGGVVSFIADSLTSKVKKSNIAAGIASGKMLLMSDQKPDAGFSAARAMNRNKYIYASAMGTFVIESDFNKGGTWSGATEAIKKGWGKVFVWNVDILGNKKLIEAGAFPYILSTESIQNTLKSNEKKEMNEVKCEQLELSSFFDLNS